MACHIPPLKKAEKLGEMPLPSLSPITKFYIFLMGKSAFVNGLIGREVAIEGDSAASVKKLINAVAIFDTPGLFDPRAGCDRETLQEIYQKLKA